MSCQATMRHVGSVAIIDLRGNISMAGGIGDLRDAVKSALDAGSKNILLNLDGVEYMDSSGLGEMAGSYITVSNLGGNLKLVHTRPRVDSLLQITRLYTVLVSFADEESALASFSS
jgi:anti-anti-sigma factor